MAFLLRSKNAVTTILRKQNIEQLADRPLNYYPDQVSGIEPQLRQLSLERGLHSDLEKLGIPCVLIGGAVGFLLRRSFAGASFCLAGLLLQQVFVKRRPHVSLSRRPGRRKRSEIEVERYALKAQRGDFGKLEVIPFR